MLYVPYMVYSTVGGRLASASPRGAKKCRLELSAAAGNLDVFDVNQLGQRGVEYRLGRLVAVDCLHYVSVGTVTSRGVYLRLVLSNAGCVEYRYRYGYVFVVLQP